MKIDLNKLSLEELELVVKIAKKQNNDDKPTKEKTKNTGVSRTKAKFKTKKKERYYKPWTLAEDDALYKMYVEGKTAKQIARKLKRTLHGVQSRTSQRKLKRSNKK